MKYSTLEGARALGSWPDVPRSLQDVDDWECDPVLKGYVGSPYGPDRPANVHSTALASSIQVKAGQTLLYGFTVLSTAAAAQFIQWFDKQLAPVNGDIPAGVIAIGANASSGSAWTPTPRMFLVGCWIANSSTVATLTAGSADCFFDVQYL